MLRCSVCGGATFTSRKILWPELIAEWEIAPHEVEYVDRQQGRCCTGCGASLRVIALGNAIQAAVGVTVPISTLAQDPAAASIRILDLNGADALSPVLSQFPGYLRADYPHVDIHALPYADGTFDLVLHSDTLEHIVDPVSGLRECRRVLSPGGRLCYTVPIIVGRMTRSREDLPPSFHGSPDSQQNDFIVQTEFGADAWTFPLLAGFSAVSLHAVEFPAAHVITAWNGLTDLPLLERQVRRQQKQRIARLRQEIDSMKTSRSWRLTAPLRRIAARLRP